MLHCLVCVSNQRLLDTKFKQVKPKLLFISRKCICRNSGKKSSSDTKYKQVKPKLLFISRKCICRNSGKNHQAFNKFNTLCDILYKGGIMPLDQET